MSLRRALGVACGLLAVCPAGAAGATVSAPGGAPVLMLAGEGERNDVRVSNVAGELVLNDFGTPLVAGPGCRAVGDGSVACTYTAGLEVRLGDGDDVLDSEVGASVDDGPGRDVVRLDGEAILFGGAGADRYEVQGKALLLGGRVPDGADTLIASDESAVSYAQRRTGVRVVLGARGGEDRLFGVVRVRGGLGPDRIVSRLADDVERVVLDGGPGDDTVAGSGAAERLAGGSGNDLVDGGKGIDRLDGGPGRDRLLARDGETEYLTCSRRPGRDVATADATDFTERCVRAQRPRPARTVLSLDALDEYVEYLQVGDPVAIHVLCPADAGPCRGRVELRSHRGVVATARYRLRAGRHRVVLAACRDRCRRLQRSAEPGEYEVTVRALARDERHGLVRLRETFDVEI